LLTNNLLAKRERKVTCLGIVLKVIFDLSFGAIFGD